MDSGLLGLRRILPALLGLGLGSFSSSIPVPGIGLLGSLLMGLGLGGAFDKDSCAIWVRPKNGASLKGFFDRDTMILIVFGVALVAAKDFIPFDSPKVFGGACIGLGLSGLAHGAPRKHPG